MKSTSQLILLGMLSSLCPAAAGAESATARGVDTSKWKCELCKFEDGLSGAVEVGAGYVSEDSAKFGEYTGLNQEGAFFIGEGNARFRGADGTYWNADASNLGLDSRALGAEGGRQGRYKLFLRYEELPHYLSDTARTPFVGSGGPVLTLPAGFPAGTTSLMPLAGTLRSFDIDNERQRLGFGAALTPARDWEYALDFRREKRDGTKRTAGAFFINAAQLIEPVDYVTDQLNASAAYSGARFQAKLAYYGSRFSNDHPSLTWQNPFTPLFGGATGQLALPPDNMFHQISASAGYNFSAYTRASFDIAYGRMTQDESFLAPTLNPAPFPAPPIPLPRTALDGRVDTLNAALKLSSALTNRLRLNAAYIHDDRDNRTPQATYTWVTTDMFLGAPRTNLPYSFTRDRAKLSADYTATPRLKGSVGVEHEEMDRTFQEASKTRENTVWGKIAAKPLDYLGVTLKLVHGERDNKGYQPVPGIDPPENPLLRKYNMADRTRNSGDLRADIATTERISVGVGVAASENDYKDSPIGLTYAEEYSLYGDVSLLLSEQTTLHFFANHQVIKSEQLGSQTFSTADWQGKNRDRTNLVGLGIKHAAIKDKLDLGADLTFMRSKSSIVINGAAPAPGFPDLSASLNGLKLYAIYRLKENISLNAGYWYERYDSDNWMLDGVGPATIPNVLTFGEQSPRYDLHLFKVSVKYRF